MWEYDSIVEEYEDIADKSRIRVLLKKNGMSEIFMLKFEDTPTDEILEFEIQKLCDLLNEPPQDPPPNPIQEDI